MEVTAKEEEGVEVAAKEVEEEVKKGGGGHHSLGERGEAVTWVLSVAASAPTSCVAAALPG